MVAPCRTFGGQVQDLGASDRVVEEVCEIGAERLDQIVFQLVDLKWGYEIDVLGGSGLVADPDFAITPRYWVRESEVRRTAGTDREWFIGFRDIARSTDERTAIFSLLPLAGVGHTLPLVLSSTSSREQAAAIGCVNSLVFDFVARQKVGGTHLTFFVVKQLPVLPPETYTPELLDLIVPHVLELTYTAHDLASFARDCGYDGPPFPWNEERRAHLRADLDGIYAHLYGLDWDDFAYILDQFPIVRRNDEKVHGEYRTGRLCLDAWDRFAGVVP